MDKQSSERRSFFTSLNAGVLSLVAMAAGGTAKAQEKPQATTRWEPARHDKDDWLEMPVKHRLVFDTTNADSLGQAIFFANNFIRVNRADYGLQNSELAVVIVVRHNSTAFGYSDAMWAKYGTAIAARAGMEDPKSKQAPKINMFNSGEYGELLLNRGVTLDALFKQGVHLAVCSSATRATAGAIAKAVGGETDAIYNELTANLVSSSLSSSRMIPAGIVTVARAQERGYSLVTT
jgi:intracellular sulfur oxidation DsrE/DsrF family protein